MIAENALELAKIAEEVGAEVLQGKLTYPSDTGNWRLGEVDLSEWLARFRGKHIILTLAEVDTNELLESFL